MSAVLGQALDYTYNGQESNEIFYKQAVMYPDLMRVFRVMTNIPYKKQLNLLNPLGKILQGAQGCGTLQTTGDRINITNRTLETCPGEFYLEQCAEVFEQSIFDEFQPAGERWYNQLGTPMGNAVQRLIVETLGREIFRVASFGDTTSPAGDPSYYGWCDGMWTTLIGNSNYEVTKVNDNITVLNQTSGTRALDYLRNLFTGAKIILKQVPNNQKRFFVTGNVWENLLQTYQDQSISNGGLTSQTENGIDVLRFNGILVDPVYAWDDWIEADNLGNNTRILYTTPENHVFGLNNPVNNGTSATIMRQWFDPNTNLTKFFGRLHLGYNYVHGDLQAISYGNV